MFCLRVDFLQNTVEDLMHRVARRTWGHHRDRWPQPTKGNEHREGINDQFGFSLRSPFSNRPLSKLGHTLEEAGLTPSAVVVFQLGGDGRAI